ncbi:aminotransferase class V-fold PLP-dependent enzyme [Streptomyces sp. NPDC005438]|uniref:aminotransferase class V-fold PLP-dependent enzyme n=1 Tax=Streptomyces sp. NPDC005438 TaxID=3156880 RepID=UPI0033AE909F
MDSAPGRGHSGDMETAQDTPTPRHSLAGEDFAPRDGVYLNTASAGIAPLASASAVSRAAEDYARGRLDLDQMFVRFQQVRETFARIARVPSERVALGASVAVHAALVAASLPEDTEVLVPEGDFSSLVTPFDLSPRVTLRAVPLERLAEEVGPRTSMVVTSAAQSRDGRVADLPAVRTAAHAHGARVLVDGTQAVGWMDLDPDHYDYLLCGAYKWLMCPHGVSFLVVPPEVLENPGSLVPYRAGWVAGAVPWDSTYGPVREFADTARRYDERPAFLSYLGALPSLELVERHGTRTIGAWDLALAERFRAGARDLGLEPVDAPSPIVAVPGLGERAEALGQQGVRVSVRAGNLRAAFHLYNSEADVDRLLEVLAPRG